MKDSGVTSPTEIQIITPLLTHQDIQFLVLTIQNAPIPCVKNV